MRYPLLLAGSLVLLAGCADLSPRELLDGNRALVAELLVGQCVEPGRLRNLVVAGENVAILTDTLIATGVATACP